MMRLIRTKRARMSWIYIVYALLSTPLIANIISTRWWTNFRSRSTLFPIVRFQLVLLRVNEYVYKSMYLFSSTELLRWKSHWTLFCFIWTLIQSVFYSLLQGVSGWSITVYYHSRAPAHLLFHFISFPFLLAYITTLYQ